MKVGICCSADQAAAAIEAGFDYAEVAAHNLADKVDLLNGLPIEATNLFFPGNFRLFEPTHGDYLAHGLTVTAAANRLGVKVMVIGSGAQRRAGDEWGPADALDRFVEIVGEIAEAAKDKSITIAPESLTRDETNVANSLGQMARALQTRQLGYTADSFHVLRECHYDGHIADWTVQIPFAPAHVHFADFPRNVPELDNQDTLGFLARLKELGYDSRISFEGSLAQLSLSQAAERIRMLWELA